MEGLQCAVGVACWAAARERGSVTVAALASAACMARRREVRSFIGSPCLRTIGAHRHESMNMVHPVESTHRHGPASPTSANVTTSCPSGSASWRGPGRWVSTGTGS